MLCADALELQGLCDVVHVFSAGRVAATLEGPTVTETNIAAAMVGGGDGKVEETIAARSTAAKRFLKGDLAPILPSAR